MDETIMQPAEALPEAEPASTATAAAEPTDETGEASDTTPAADTEQDVPPGDGQPIVIPVRYNHESRELTLEEAQALAQKGLKFDELSPTLDKIRYLAAANQKSVQEMVDALVDGQDKQLYQSILEECGGNEALAKRLYEAEKDKWSARYANVREEEAKAPEKDKAGLTERLANEFVELKADFPDVAEFKQVPQPVVDMAVNKGISLTDAYLRYQHANARKASAAKAAQEAASKASPGPQAAGAGETTNPTIDAMLAGVWNR